jgi:hypothetical protein
MTRPEGGAYDPEMVKFLWRSLTTPGIGFRQNSRLAHKNPM